MESCYADAHGELLPTSLHADAHGESLLASLNRDIHGRYRHLYIEMLTDIAVLEKEFILSKSKD